MDLLIEFILELFLEGSIEVISDRKVPKWIRYPLMAVITAFFLFVIGMIVICAIMVFPKNKLLSIFLLFVVVVLIAGMIYRFKKYILKIKDK